MQDPYYTIFWAVDTLLTFFLVVMVVRIALSWMFAFQVINPRHPLAWQLDRISKLITDPVMRPIQRAIPPFSGLDLSPLVVFLVIYVLQQVALPQLYETLAR